MSNPPFNEDGTMNMWPLTDEQVLKKWTVDELDMLHNLAGLGAEWMESDRRAHLLRIEKGEVEHLENIIAEIKIEEPRPKVGKWIQLTYENIVNLDLPARSGIDRGELERRADQAVRRSEIIHIWVED